MTASDPYEFSQLDLTNSDVKSTTRIACLQLHTVVQCDSEEKFACELLADWVCSGPAAGSGVTATTDQQGTPHNIPPACMTLMDRRGGFLPHITNISFDSSHT